jgi:hypothetical protein
MATRLCAAMLQRKQGQRQEEPAMTIQMPSITAAPKQRKTQVLTAAAGVVLALATAAGVGAWQAGRDGGSVGEQPATSMPAPVQRAIGRTAAAAPTYYLVASAADAGAVEAALEEANAVRVTSGEATRAPQVTWFDSTEAEASFWSARAEQERAGPDLAPVRVVDLRTPVASAAAQDPAAFSDQELFQRWHQAQAAAPAAPATTDAMPERNGERAAVVQRSVYLLGSEEAATAARQLAAGADQVLVVATEEDAAQVRVGLTQPGTAIIDLRTPATGASGVCRTANPPTEC